MKKTDIDIDTKNRDELIKVFKCIPALERFNDDELIKHKSGVHFDDIPTDPITGYSSIPYKDAELLGYQKIDFLNVSVYNDVKDRAHLKELINTEPQWELFKIPEIVGELFQLGNQVSITMHWAPTNIDELAMLIAMIRPAKKHLIGAMGWEEIKKDIWDYTNTNNQAYFKKSHAYAYAHAIIVQLNALVQKLSLL